jgi:ribose transport system permease protein
MTDGVMTVSEPKTKSVQADPTGAQSAAGGVAVPNAGAGFGARLAAARESLGSLGSKAYLFVVGVLVLVVGSQLSPYFLTSRNLVAVLITASVVSVIAVGQFMVIVTGGIDLSVGSVAALSSVVGALVLQHGAPFPIAVVVALIMAAVIGLVNGGLIVYGKVTPFIVTLAMLSVAQGLAYMIQTGRLVPINDQSFMSFFTGDLGPFPAPVLIALVVMLVATVIMAFRPFGRRLYALGGNPEAARLSGLPVKRDTISAYVLSSTLAGLGGLMMAAQLTEGSAIIGNGYELNSIAAVVVGGASLFGGTGGPVSAVLGGLIIAVVLNVMDLLGVEAQSQLVVKGLVILLAVLFTSGAGGKQIPRLLNLLVRRPGRATPAQTPVVTQADVPVRD